MRAGTRYDCERCGLSEVERPRLCDPLCKHPSDENGNAPPRPREQSYDWYGGSPDQIFPMLARSVFVLATGLKRIRTRRQIRRLTDAAGDAVPISRATDGLVAIRGRVRVLEPATSEDPSVAAFVRRDVTTRKLRPMTTVDRVSVSRAFGRFLVLDDTGAALLDDDWLRLFDSEGDEPDPAKAGQVTVLDQESVLVVGYCRRGGVTLPAGAAASFRGPPASIEFVGGSRRPVCVFLD